MEQSRRRTLSVSSLKRVDEKIAKRWTDFIEDHGHKTPHARNLSEITKRDKESAMRSDVIYFIRWRLGSLVADLEEAAETSYDDYSTDESEGGWSSSRSRSSSGAQST